MTVESTLRCRSTHNAVPTHGRHLDDNSLDSGSHHLPQQGVLLATPQVAQTHQPQAGTAGRGGEGRGGEGRGGEGRGGEGRGGEGMISR